MATFSAAFDFVAGSPASVMRSKAPVSRPASSAMMALNSACLLENARKR